MEKICFVDFVNYVSVYIFKEMCNAFELLYDKGENVVIYFDNKSIAEHMSYRSRSEPLTENDLPNYFNKFKDEFSRRGIVVKQKHSSEGISKFLVCEEEFLPTLLDLNLIDKNQLSKLLLNKLINVETRLREIEFRLNI